MKVHARRLAVFPDTNVFQHCHPITDLAWFEEFDCDELQVMIAVTVIEELDRHKADGNSRRAQRARAAHTLFRRMLDEASMSITFECAGKPVAMRFAPALPAGRPAVQGLDLSRPDDRLLEEVLSFSTAEIPAVLLSRDTGIELKARRNSIAFKRVPERWDLAPESDDRDKQVRNLQMRVAALEEREPQITLKLLKDDQEIEKLAISLPYWPPLTAQELESLSASLKARHPCAHSFPDPPKFKAKNILEKKIAESFPLEALGVSKEEIAKYQSEYATWFDDALKRLERFPRLWNLKHRWHHFTIEIDNKGTVPAEHLLVEIQLHDGVRACLTVDDAEEPKPYALTQHVSDVPNLPMPPAVPRPMAAIQKALLGLNIGAHPASLFRHIPDYSHLLPSAPGPKDRHGLYIHEDEDRPLSSWSLDCEEFRHRRGARVIGCWLMVPEDIDVAQSRLFLRATARNMSSAIEKYVALHISYARRSSVELASQWSVGALKDDENALHADEDAGQKAED